MNVLLSLLLTLMFVSGCAVQVKVPASEPINESLSKQVSETEKQNTQGDQTSKAEKKKSAVNVPEPDCE